MHMDHGLCTGQTMEPELSPPHIPQLPKTSPPVSAFPPCSHPAPSCICLPKAKARTTPGLRAPPGCWGQGWLRAASVLPPHPNPCLSSPAFCGALSFSLLLVSLLSRSSLSGCVRVCMCVSYSLPAQPMPSLPARVTVQMDRILHLCLGSSLPPGPGS